MPDLRPDALDETSAHASNATVQAPDAPAPAELLAAPVPAQLLAAPPQPDLLEGPNREDLIRGRAFELYLSRGCGDGNDQQDWFQAEAEVDLRLRDVANAAT